MSDDPRGSSPAAAARAVTRGYGPLAVAAVAFLVMTLTVSPSSRTSETVSGGGDLAVAAGPGRGPETSAEQAGVAGTDGSTGRSAQTGAAGGQAPAGTGPADATTGGGPSGPVPPGAAPCADRAVQVSGDPYSPPCLVAVGDNGGVTYRGVTADSIVVTARELEGPTAAEIFADISGQDVNDSPEAVRDTVLALAEYFSERFELYGRRIQIEFFDGQGNGADELLGRGQEAARSDAIKAAQEKQAFADISAVTLPYAASLTDQGVVNIGAPYPSRAWFVKRRPYSWSGFPDGTRVAESAAAAMKTRMGPVAEYAGPTYAGRPRKYALVSPENDEYQESVDVYVSDLSKNGIDVALQLTYKLDLPSMPNQASRIIAQLKDADVTTVLCACDPVMLALGMAPKANEQEYEPEWVTAGLAFVDQDIVAQLIDTRQWKRAFGIAYNAESEPLGASYAYAAYKTMRPDDEPAFGVEAIYFQLYILTIGIQMAGPELTPATFERGMFAYPGGTGPQGTWGFGEGDYTTTDDFREIWWDPDRVSPQNNQPGAWVQLNGGARYFTGTVPNAKAEYFR